MKISDADSVIISKLNSAISKVKQAIGLAPREVSAEELRLAKVEKFWNRVIVVAALLPALVPAVYAVVYHHAKKKGQINNARAHLRSLEYDIKRNERASERSQRMTANIKARKEVNAKLKEARKAEKLKAKEAAKTKAKEEKRLNNIRIQNEKDRLKHQKKLKAKLEKGRERARKKLEKRKKAEEKALAKRAREAEKKPSEKQPIKLQLLSEEVKKLNAQEKEIKPKIGKVQSDLEKKKTELENLKRSYWGYKYQLGEFKKAYEEEFNSIVERANLAKSGKDREIHQVKLKHFVEYNQKKLKSKNAELKKMKERLQQLEGLIRKDKKELLLLGKKYRKIVKKRPSPKNIKRNKR